MSLKRISSQLKLVGRHTYKRVGLKARNYKFYKSNYKDGILNIQTSPIVLVVY